MVEGDRGSCPRGLLGYTEEVQPDDGRRPAPRQLLAAGRLRPEANQLSLDLTYAEGDPELDTIVTVMKANLAKVGIDLQAKALAWPTQWDIGKSEDLAKRQDIFLFYWYPDYADPFSWFVNLYRSANPPYFNLSYWDDPQATHVIDGLQALTATDRDEAQEQYVSCRRRMLDQAVSPVLGVTNYQRAYPRRSAATWTTRPTATSCSSTTWSPGLTTGGDDMVSYLGRAAGPGARRSCSGSWSSPSSSPGWCRATRRSRTPDRRRRRPARRCTSAVRPGRPAAATAPALPRRSVAGRLGTSLHTKAAGPGRPGPGASRPPWSWSRSRWSWQCSSGSRSGIFAARSQGRLGDVVAKVVAILSVSMPVFWLAMLLQLCSSRGSAGFPVAGQYDPRWTRPARCTPWSRSRWWTPS